MNIRKFKKRIRNLKSPIPTWHRTILSALLILCIVVIGILSAKDMMTNLLSSPAPQEEPPPPFPVSIDLIEKSITENPIVEDYFLTQVMGENIQMPQTSWFGELIRKFTRLQVTQNLASTLGRIVVVWPGERSEQIAANFGKALGWSDEEKRTFRELVMNTEPILTEGKFYPNFYNAPSNATPEDIATEVISKFDREVLARYTDEVAEKVPLEDALIIASILEREAYDFTDMREISGIIWNRLFIDMNLQLDATLQYAKGSSPQGPWWPRIVPRDKYIDSPFNTYKHTGLPPAPISNPSLDTILAALNPINTDCIFYFHDRNSRFHCSETYQEHVALIRLHYGTQ
ncbi:MAG: endolytic transglycosylase MltG [Candidatus Paceibacterota bacterium]